MYGYEVANALHPYINSIKSTGDQLSGALVNGFQGAFIGLYESIANGRDVDGLNFSRLGYEPLLNMESTEVWNNGKNVNINFHSRGGKAFAKQYAYDLISIFPLTQKYFKNPIVDRAFKGGARYGAKSLFD